MPDVFTKAKRSDVMSRIRGHGNKDTELALAGLFRRHGITGWRRQLSILVRGIRRQEAPSKILSTGGRTKRPVRASSPRLLRAKVDIVFTRLRLAVFVDGCFWHGCPKHATQPRNNAGFWRKKFAANQARDRFVTRTLRKGGWRVLRIWEHELTRKNEARLLRRIQKGLNLEPG